MGEGPIFSLTLHEAFIIGFGIAKEKNFMCWIVFTFLSFEIEFKRKTEKNSWFEFHNYFKE